MLDGPPITYSQVRLIGHRRPHKIGPSLNHKTIQTALYDIRREVSYLVYESSPTAIQRGIAQDAVSGACLECDQQLVQVSVSRRRHCLNASSPVHVGNSSQLVRSYTMCVKHKRTRVIAAKPSCSFFL